MIFAATDVEVLHVAAEILLRRIEHAVAFGHGIALPRHRGVLPAVRARRIAQGRRETAGA
jgi:hypothetical protein